MKASLTEITARGRARLGRTIPLLDPGTSGLRALIALGVLAAVFAGVLLWRSRPVAEPVTPPSPVAMPATGPTLGETAVGGTAGTPATTSQVVVHVTGKVRKPGVITLAAGSRVADAIKAAGGVRMRADPSGINLARRLVDGEQIVVGADPALTPGGQFVRPGGPAVVNLNTATVDQLDALPGVGEVLAQRIVEFRDSHGGFHSVDQLREVSGIGDRKYAELKDHVTV